MKAKFTITLEDGRFYVLSELPGREPTMMLGVYAPIEGSSKDESEQIAAGLKEASWFLIAGTLAEIRKPL